MTNDAKKPTRDESESDCERIGREAAEAMEARIAAHRASGCSIRPCAHCELARCARCGEDVPFADLEREKLQRAVAGRPLRVLCFDCAPVDTRERLLASARIAVPDFYRPLRFSTPEMASKYVLEGRGAHLLALAREAVDGRRGVTFQGLPAMGKTSLLAAMMGELLDRAASLAMPEAVVERAANAWWTTAAALSSAHVEHPRGQGTPPLIARSIEASVLVLDEITDQLERPGAVRDVVFARFDAGRPTWASTGLGADDLARVYGGGFVRRIAAEATLVRMVPAGGA